MKSLFFTVFFFLSFYGFSQRQISVPNTFSASFKRLGLDKKYSVSGFLQPTTITGDFNGDGIDDIAVSIVDNKSSKEGFLILHGKLMNYYVFGAGVPFGSGGDDFTWADKWELYKKKTASESQFDKKSGDIIGSKTVTLIRPGIWIEKEEAGAGGIVYWNGKRYVWIHQGE